jgi:hypothetical protein
MKRFCVGLAAAAFAALCSQGAAVAQDYRPGYGYKRYYHKQYGQYRPRYRAYRRFGAGGHASGDQYTPYVYYNGSYTTGPWFDNRTFWERVETSADYPVR